MEDQLNNKPTLAQLVERRTVVGSIPQLILRSLVRIRQVGTSSFFVCALQFLRSPSDFLFVGNDLFKFINTPALEKHRRHTSYSLFLRLNDLLAEDVLRQVLHNDSFYRLLLHCPSRHHRMKMDSGRIRTADDTKYLGAFNERQ
ncbi:hypothetical protein SLE2022_314540 [Rubroshorea leprosula]